MTIYQVCYRLDTEDDAWLVDVDGLPEVCTYGRSLDEAAVNAREAIAVMEDISESDVELDESLDVDGADIDGLSYLREQQQEQADSTGGCAGVGHDGR